MGYLNVFDNVFDTHAQNGTRATWQRSESVNVGALKQSTKWFSPFPGTSDLRPDPGGPIGSRLGGGQPPGLAGKCWATGTEDMDALTFGTPRLLRHLTVSEAKKQPILEIHLERVCAPEGCMADTSGVC